jgi:hypothetical protein
MRLGRMDKSGESPTLAGMVFGIIVSGLWMLGGAVLALVLFVAAVRG